MIRHLFTLIWNRRRANALLTAEIFLAFVVLFAVGSLATYLRQNYQAPLGFTYEHVWTIDLNAGNQPHDQQFATLQQVLLRLRTTPGVEVVSRSLDTTPFSFNSNTNDLFVGAGTEQRQTEADVYYAGPEMRDVLGLQLTEGRWFDRRDEATNRRPVVITEATRRELFLGQSPLGKIVRREKDELQVVGVIDAYRAGGQLSKPQPGILLYVSPQDTTDALFTLLVRVRPGAGAALAKKISEDIRAIGPTWTSTIVTLPEQRLTQLKQLLSVPVFLGVVCLFLILNVALGLFGVLWLNISQRRAEIGLRRAIGASAGNISGQIVGEILVLTTFGLLLGLLVAMQFPLLNVFNVQPGIYLTAILLATGGLYLLAAICALYPSRLAAGIQPAVALREE